MTNCKHKGCKRRKLTFYNYCLKHINDEELKDKNEMPPL